MFGISKLAFLKKKIMVIYTSEKNSIAIKWQYRNHENSRLVKQQQQQQQQRPFNGL